jgi:hypothetical protein
MNFEDIVELQIIEKAKLFLFQPNKDFNLSNFEKKT